MMKSVRHALSPCGERIAQLIPKGISAAWRRAFGADNWQTPLQLRLGSFLAKPSYPLPARGEGI